MAALILEVEQCSLLSHWISEPGSIGTAFGISLLAGLQAEM